DRRARTARHAAMREQRAAGRSYRQIAAALRAQGFDVSHTTVKNLLVLAGGPVNTRTLRGAGHHLRAVRLESPGDVPRLDLKQFDRVARMPVIADLGRVPIMCVLMAVLRSLER